MMPVYLEHFGLAEAPFAITPDPRYLYLSAGHREALAHLLYGLNSDDGFVAVTGDVGSGKTMLCRCLLDQLPPGCDVAIIFNPTLTPIELLASLCERFEIFVPEGERNIRTLFSRLSSHLLDAHARGRRSVLVIDEGQGLGADVLEQLRLLTNLETDRCKLLRIVMLGQTRLRDVLEREDMLPLAQRIVARYHLGPLSRQETAALVNHRLAAAGTQRELFAPAALALLHELSGGLPRRINILADRALLGAYSLGKTQVQPAMVAEAHGEVAGTRRKRLHRVVSRAAMFGLGTACSVAAAAAYVYYDGSMLSRLPVMAATACIDRPGEPGCGR